MANFVKVGGDFHDLPMDLLGKAMELMSGSWLILSKLGEISMHLPMDLLIKLRCLCLDFTWWPSSQVMWMCNIGQCDADETWSMFDF